MQITFVSQARFPTEKAHGHQIAQVCASLQQLGHAVTLVAPDVTNTVHKDSREYYGLAEPLTVVRLPVFDGHRVWWVPGPLAFFFTMRSYARALRAWLNDHPAHVLYTRSSLLLPVLLSADTPVIVELHTLPRRTSRFVDACRRCAAVVCLTEPMRRELISWGVATDRVIVEGDGVDPSKYASLPPQAEARAHWRLPSDRHVIVYVGSLVTRGTIEKGVKELIGAIAILKKEGKGHVGKESEGREGAALPIFLWIVGGPREKMEEYRSFALHAGLLSEDVRFEGPVQNARVPSALAAADVCVYPAPASQHPFFLRDTSPLKVFEYLAAGRPTVCADIPPLRGVFDPSLVHFCVPGDALSIAHAIEQALRDPRANEPARQSLLRHIAWSARMGRILDRALQER